MKKSFLFLIFIGCFIFNVNSQNFITTWDVGSSPPPNAITFDAVTTGVVNYTWQSTTTSASGSGSFQGPNVQISGLPPGETITLSIQPQNFRRFKSNFFSFFGGALLQVNQWGSVQWISMEDAFMNSQSLQVTASDVPNLVNCTSLKNMFKSCFALNSPFNLNAWNISTITNLSGMFQECTNFNQALSQWNTANVTNMSSMFESALFFNQNIGSWNTGNVTTMSKMFKNASAFDRNIGTWNTSSVTDMSEMFYQNLFSGLEPEFNRNLGNWNTSNVTNMAGMFHGAAKFNQNIGNWNTSNVLDMSEMFKWAFVFNQNLGNWNTSNVTDMSEMFSCPSLFFSNNFPLTPLFNNLGNPSIGNWNTSNVVNMTDMFSRATSFNQSLQNWVLNPNVVLLGMLDNSGIDCTKYSLTLIGWNSNPLTPNNKLIGVTFLEYGLSAQVALNNLSLNKGWLFSGHDVISTIPEFVFETIFCAGAVIPALPTSSVEGIQGTWSPAINNQQTTTYTFTPNFGECAIPTTVTIFVNPSVQALFDSIDPICFGQSLTPLPTTSLNGINGSWSPSLSNQQTTTYFFTTSGNQCTQPTSLTIVVTPQPPAPTNLACYETAVYNNSNCTWDVLGVQPPAPSNLACWQTANFNGTTCSWDVIGTQPQAPSGLACWQTSTFNNATCQWVIGGVFPAAPSGLACWQSTTFNNTTCQWVITGNQPAAPTELACWQTAVFNTSTCSWNIVGSQPQAPTNLACWQTSIFNGTSCQWIISGNQPTAPTNLACYETASFNSNTCSWDVSGSQPVKPANLACWETAQFNPITCEWDVSGEPIVPVFSFQTTYCTGDSVADLPTTSVNSIEGTWSPEINNLQNTTYTFIPNEGVCSLSKEITIEIFNYPNVVFTQLGTTLTATPGFNSYAWSFNETPLPDETTNSIQLDENGEYEVIVTNNAGCTDTFYFYFASASITENSLTTGVSVYPNPSDGMSTLLLETMQGKKVQLMIKDMQGKLYVEQELEVTTPNQLFPIDLRAVASGVYHVVLSIEEKTIHLRLVLR